ncbi:Twinfilin-1 [Microsporum canis]|uniref:Twinfilin A n=1 Tax=Arthroderma otae (strain ATCC MYA-4605 / CBS 113480) TaxID=554155 RepID=C5FMI4_ARTOC|nr:twinfilin A [Microsporum canis CBS 113480]EEQ31087.1 twinfilin A [Microsporum canis CBS 113480]
MQSGITVSKEVHDAFESFMSDPSLFCLPITITSEQLVALQPIPFAQATGGSNGLNSQFYTSLPSLSDHLQPKTPIYLFLRRSSENADLGLIALTFVPSNSPVRSKTLFASTRTALIRELGSEKFAENIFATDVEEVLDEEEWKERELDMNAKSGAGGSSGDDRLNELMGEQERELNAVKREENDARDTWKRRMDIGIGGTVGSDTNSAGQLSGPGASDSSVLFKTGVGVEGALQSLGQDGAAVLLAIDVKTETLNLVGTESNVAPDSLSGLIPTSDPQYTFYRHPESSELIFIYTCPSGSSIKQRMLHASSRAGMLMWAAKNGVSVNHKIEASAADEITPDRLKEEISPPAQEVKKAFARPKRPGKR